MGRLKDIAASRKDAFCIPLESVIRCDNVRSVVDLSHVEHLAKSIASVGQLEPVKGYVNGDGVVITNGEHRYLGIKMANEKFGAQIETILFMAESRGANEETRIVEQLAENAGLPMTPIDTAKAYKRLLVFGWSEEKIAESVGKSRTHVVDTINLLSATKEVREAVEKRAISASAAKKLAKAKPEVQREVIKKAKEKGERLTVAKAQKETTGKLTMVSAREIREKVAEFNSMLTAGIVPEAPVYKGIVLGLLLAAGDISKDTVLAEAKRGEVSNEN